MKDELEKIIKLELNLEYIPRNFKCIIKKGDTIAEIKKYLTEEDIDCTFMGTRDKYNLFEKVIGTVSLATIKTTYCPTYLIPKFAEYKPYKKVLIASDHHILRNQIGRWIKKWNSPFNAFIKFLHIREKDEEFIKETDQLVYELFDDSEPTFGFEVQNLKSKKIGNTLLESAYSFGADLLISMPDKQSFISALFLKSVTKELIEKSNIPLLFIPNNEIQI